MPVHGITVIWLAMFPMVPHTPDATDCFTGGLPDDVFNSDGSNRAASIAASFPVTDPTIWTSPAKMTTIPMAPLESTSP